MQTKAKCQRFTPSVAVREMLQMADYCADDNIIGKKVLENSFGNGSIIIEIVKEYINACFKRDFSPAETSRSLGQNIYGIELDAELYKETICKLNSLTEEQGLPQVSWQLYNQDALYWNCSVKFDFIIGNPPYIAYSEIDAETRESIKTKYSTCSVGKFDYCYAFIESALDKLSPEGKLVQLIPNNIYKNVFAEKLRDRLRPHIKQINIYPSQKLFDEVLTSTSIFLYDNSCINDTVRCINKTLNDEHFIEREKLHGKWVLSNQDNREGDTLFGDLFKASSSAVTLLNEAFLISTEQAGNIEGEVVRPAVSPKSLHFNRSENIIFPYSYSAEGGLQRYNEQDFQEKFPRATAHLNSFRERLDSRASDKTAKWFEYGRSQALTHINQRKLLISTVVTNKVEVYQIDEESIPYAGFYIVPKDRSVDLSVAEAILKSEDFLDYVKSIGISVNGKSIRITCKDINNYRFSREEIDGKT